ncbi:hemolysin family protein [Chamaesiphon minutus]|uniref:CBS domain-containing protein n=1 Tax=Chamaesiphon minutus (strain ATCC 27169 / PCC 6605) TaxID=1173020 RepID=K9U9T1_CHAP6|nr:hemolysin family protein [Chamaesiphon minutus]AFY91358.1 CBS domain-containing protein [Chamaesiphon minutus PCC 6605]
MNDPHPLLGGSDIGWRLLLVLGLIAIDAFFVVAEFSILSVRRSRISQLVAAGDDRAKQVQDLQRRIDRLLSTTQVGISLSSLALGWIGERAIVQILMQYLENIPLAHSLAIPITFILLAYLQIVFGELIPKSIALIYAEQIARVLGAPSLAIARIFSPLIWVLDRSTKLCLRLVGIKERYDSRDRVTFKELQAIVSTERESSGLALEQREVLTKVLEFANKIASDVMIPCTQIVTVPKTASCQTLLIKVATTGYSRYPVTDTSLNKIVGIVAFKDFGTLLTQGKPAGQISIAKWIKPVEFVAESTPVSVVLQQMQLSDTHMTIVVDEFGNTAGLITRQDAIEEMIGMKVTSERPTQLIQKLSDGTFLVQAQINLEDLNTQLKLALPLADDYQTLAGFLLNKLQHFPQIGESLEYGDWILTIVSTIGPRIDRVRVRMRRGG